ncbi:PAN2-PAN3 deadenylation complex catalytic subunit PAN2 [Nymphon striatum]|nr:PAN2-PAN3 deadenylation complex catalytic subunit PAN2 [Nymphon striatum]
MTYETTELEILFGYRKKLKPDAVPTIKTVLSEQTGVPKTRENKGYLHLFGTNNDISFNPFSKPTEFADPVQEINSIHINDELASFSTIAMPSSRSGQLLSDWPDEYLKVTYRPTAPISQAILKSMKLVQSIGYAPKPPQMMCNQVPYKLSGSKNDSQRRSKQPNSSEIQNARDANAPVIPKRYLKVEVKYSKMGFNDFDFNRYNKTCFSGLEAILPNAYCNCMLQTMFFTEPIRRTMLNHLCDMEFCLSCELGFLFHMLENSQGLPCQASNFLRTFRFLPEGAALGLVLPEDDEALRKKINSRRLIQSWNRFILSQLHSELMRPKQLQEKGETHSEDEADINDSDELGSSHIMRRRYNSGEKTEPRQAGLKGHPKTTRYCKLTNNYKSEETPISKMFGTQTITQNVCKCGAQYYHNSESFLCFLSYPEGISNSDSTVPLMSFPEILEKSFSAEKIMQAWCEACKKYQTTVQTKLLRNIPDILAVNCGLETNSNLKFWKAQVEAGQAEVVSEDKTAIKPCRYGNACTRQDCKFWHEDLRNAGKSVEETIPIKIPATRSSWLPTHLKIKLDENGAAIVKECTSEEMESKSAELDDGFILYELTSVVSHIVDTRNKGKDNLVSCIKVGGGYHQRTGALVSSDLTQWYLFNDFSVYPVAPEEAVWLALDWKIPCFLYYSRKDLNFRNNVEINNPFTSAVFDDDKSLAAKASQKVTFVPLTRDERPLEGELIAMDAEFVTINQEEALLRSDGTRSTIKPCQMSVARITCIRGEGEMEGVPFIDDYISTQEQVVDYLTKFSGIRPGDLDVSISSKHLTTLKSTYKKLHYLIDTEVHFVGHGLKNDFRVINLVIPPEQVHDTVLLFYLPNQRLISLRFLAWHFLGMFYIIDVTYLFCISFEVCANGLNIQSVTHDSIEDAKTALKLYREYQKLEASGQIKEALKGLYETGRNMQWKVPESGHEMQ